MLRDLVVNQAKINEGINKRLLANDKTLGLLTSKMDSLASAVKDQQNFNKVLESWMTQIATSVNSCYSSNAVTTRGGKTTCDPPYPNMTRKPARKDKQDEEDKVEEVELPSTEGSTKFNGKVAPHEFCDTNLLMQFPRTRTQKTDEQFGKFVEVIRQLYVNILLLDAMQVPTYAKYLETSSTTRSCCLKLR